MAYMTFIECEHWLAYLRAVSSESARDAGTFAAEHTRRFGTGDLMTRGRIAEITQLVAAAMLAACGWPT